MLLIALISSENMVNIENCGINDKNKDLNGAGRRENEQLELKKKKNEWNDNQNKLKHGEKND